jgi:hypothetical protein
LEGDYHRLSVAYGLSHSQLEVGETIPPEEIKDIFQATRKKENFTDNYVSAEMT